MKPKKSRFKLDLIDLQPRPIGLLGNGNIPIHHKCREFIEWIPLEKGKPNRLNYQIGEPTYSAKFKQWGVFTRIVM